MSDSSRDKIFSRLNSAKQHSYVSFPNGTDPRSFMLDREARTERLKTLMEAMRTEVYVVYSDSWMNTLAEVFKNKGIKDLLYASDTNLGAALEKYLKNDIDCSIKLVPYDRKIEEIKDRLFEIDASITSTAGAVADTGAIILWPDEKEPRTMSLVPPIHIAILEGDTIYNSLSEAINNQGWSERMPTNMLLISGPSKTADIELTLAFGVHGPKELVLLII